MKLFKNIKNWWSDYFSPTHFNKGFRAGMDAGLENGGILCKEAIRSTNEKWKTNLRQIIPNIPITKGLADGLKIRKELQRLIES